MNSLMLQGTASSAGKSLLVNRFRGEAALLGDAFERLEKRTRRPVLGWVPYLPDLALPEEDAPYSFLESGRGLQREGTAPGLRVAGVCYPRASNTSDLDPFAADPRIDFEWLREPDRLAGLDLVVLPGSKAVSADLAWLRERGWVAALQRHLRYGGRVLGICGGMQMLGRRILDPRGIEGPVETRGLGWLPIDAELRSEKRVHAFTDRARWPESAGEDLSDRWLRDLDRLADVLRDGLDLSPLVRRVGRVD